MRCSGLVLALVLLAGRSVPAAPAPSTPPPATQPAEGVEVVVTSIDPGSTRVTLEAEDVSLSELLFRIGQAAETPVGPRHEHLLDEDDLFNLRFSAEWKDQPLWDVVRQICQETNLRTTLDTTHGGARRMVLERGTLTSALAADDAVLIRARQISRTATRSYVEATAGGDQLLLTLEALVEPKFGRYGWSEPVKLEEATDETGQSLLPADDDKPRNPIHGYPASLSLPLTYPPHAPRRLARLRARLTMHVPGKVATVTFAAPFDPQREIAVPVGPNVLVLKSARVEQGGEPRFTLLLQRGAEETEPRWQAIATPFTNFQARAVVVGAKGERTHSGGSGSRNEKEAKLELSFPAPAEGERVDALRVGLPTDWQSLEAEFEFTDLPLP